MTWFKIDDGFWSHPKTMELSDSAVALWVRAGSYACQHLTDGRVPSSALRLLGDRTAAAELVNAGLWKPAGHDYIFHDWDEYQETSETVLKRRASSRERQRRFRAKLEASRRDADDDDADGDTVGNGVTDAVSNGVSAQKVFDPRPDPTRPDLLKDGGGDLGGERYLSNARESEEKAPSKNCRKHPFGSLDPCGPCKQARITAEAWHERQREIHATQAADRRAAIDACELCDETGWRIPPPGADPPVVHCDHSLSWPIAWHDVEVNR